MITWSQNDCASMFKRNITCTWCEAVVQVMWRCCLLVYKQCLPYKHKACFLLWSVGGDLYVYLRNPILNFSVICLSTVPRSNSLQMCGESGLNESISFIEQRMIKMKFRNKKMQASWESGWSDLQKQPLCFFGNAATSDSTDGKCVAWIF